jgi:GTP pyrophosphokinase
MSTVRTIEAIIEAAKTMNASSREELLRRAYAFAAEAHRGQLRSSGEPYITHPLAAALTLAHMGLDDTTIAAAILHDVVDDTPVTIEEIKKVFGEEIAFLVQGVTKLGKLKYRGVERHVENLRKMFLAMAEDIRTVLIKLADRLHNMETIAALPPEKQRRIALETLEIYAPLAGRLGIGELKAKLEDLSFPIVFPQDHRWLLSNVREAYAERHAYIDRLIPLVRRILTEENLPPVEIHARAKHYYSLWLKLQRYGMDLSKIYDLVAVRIIAPDITACYATLGALHKHWRPLLGRIKDYISVPKPNGYQSLHTTVFCEEGKIVEFQIRTPEMHAQAEYGIAAHWLYSESGKESLKRPERFRWVEQLRDWQREVRGTDEFLDTLRIDFFKDRIFVFTPKGDVIELPDGATPIDFAYHIHSELGDTAIGAKINDRFQGLDTILRNGDVVEILTKRGQKPSPKWLEFARTSLARGHIRKALREQGIETAPLRPTPFEAEVQLTVEDRVGLLKDVTTVIARFGFNMKRIVGKGEGTTGKITFTVKVHDRSDLRRILDRLRDVPGVLEASGKII